MARKSTVSADVRCVLTDYLPWSGKSPPKRHAEGEGMLTPVTPSAANADCEIVAAEPGLYEIARDNRLRHHLRQ